MGQGICNKTLNKERKECETIVIYSKLCTTLRLATAPLGELAPELPKTMALARMEER